MWGDLIEPALGHADDLGLHPFHEFGHTKPAVGQGFVDVGGFGVVEVAHHSETFLEADGVFVDFH